MQFSLLDLEMNDTCDGMNFTHLTQLMLLHYLVKVKHRKCITAGYYEDNSIRCIIVSTKWTRVIMCLKFTYSGCYTAIRV